MSRPHFDALDDFAGPGGWDEGARLLGLHFYGVDYDKAACETARAAGHHREQADVQYEQVGNAIPPLLAAHVLAAVTGIALSERSVA